MATKTKKRFGTLVREKRTARGISLRKFAELVGVSATYLSQVEQGNCDPPTAERVRRMAEILGENSDELTALAGRVPEDLQRLLENVPPALPPSFEKPGELTPDQLQVLTEQARRLRGTR